MTLIQKLNKELSKLGLRYEPTKELTEKFKGMLIDEKHNVQMPYEVPKILQWNKVSSFANCCRDTINMFIEIERMKKNEANR